MIDIRRRGLLKGLLATALAAPIARNIEATEPELAPEPDLKPAPCSGNGGDIILTGGIGGSGADIYHGPVKVTYMGRT